MNIEFVDRNKGCWIMKFSGESHTFFNLLRKKLLDDKTVKFVGYEEEHPLINKTIFTVKGSNVPLSVKNAVSDILNDINEFKKELKA